MHLGVTGKSPGCGAGGASTDLGARARSSGAATKLLAASSLRASSPFSLSRIFYPFGGLRRVTAYATPHTRRLPEDDPFQGGLLLEQLRKGTYPIPAIC